MSFRDSSRYQTQRQHSQHTLRFLQQTFKPQKTCRTRGGSSGGCCPVILSCTLASLQEKWLRSCQLPLIRTISRVLASPELLEFIEAVTKRKPDSVTAANEAITCKRFHPDKPAPFKPLNHVLIRLWPVKSYPCQQSSVPRPRIVWSLPRTQRCPADALSFELLELAG